MAEEEEDHLNPQLKTLDNNHQHSSSKCLVYTLLLVVLLSISCLTLAIIYLRIHAPTLRISNILVSDNSTTLLAQMQLHNANFGRFRFRRGNATLLRGNASIGAGTIGSGLIRGRASTGFNVTVKVSDHHQLSENYNSSGGLGLTDLRIFAEVRGQVRVVKIVRRRRTAVMNCTMGFNHTSQAIQDLSCR